MLNRASPPFQEGRGLVNVIIVHTWNSKLVKMYVDYVWICHSSHFTKAEKLLSLDCNRDLFYVFVKTFRELEVGNQQLW